MNGLLLAVTEPTTAGGWRQWMESVQSLDALIDPGDTWTLWAVILVGTAASIYLEQTYRWAAQISGPVLALMMAMVLSNLKVMPTESPAYGFVDAYLVPLAIPLLLFRANLFHIARTTGWMFAAFHISAVGTVLGACVATLLLGNQIENVPEVAGIMTGSYTGGGVNFFAVKASFDVDSNLTSPLLVADNFIMAGMFIALLFLAGSRVVRRHFPHPHSLNADTQESRRAAADHWRRKEIALLDVAQCLAVAAVVVAIATQMATAMERLATTDSVAEQLGRSANVIAAIVGNRFLWITCLSCAAATIFHRALARIHGAEEIGGYMLYVFLFAIGLPADLPRVLLSVPLMFVFCLVMALVNLAFTLTVGKLFRFNLEELLLSVNATLGGAPSAAAMAIAKGWPQLVLPALLVGIWGYVIGTFLGVLVGELMRGLL